MDEDNNLPLKRVELSLTKFNEVAIPHHLELLRQHKFNIIKLEANGSGPAMRREQAAAGRVVAQLRTLLSEMEGLRARVRPDDRARFDAATQRARDDTLRAVHDYLGPPPAASSESVGVVRDDDAPLAADGLRQGDEPLVQLRVDDHEAALREREAALRAWAELQGEVRALHDVWQHAQAAALRQREHVQSAHDSVQAAADSVASARAHLALADRLSARAVGVYGACAGALLGGPVGLAVGAKAGALAAAAGSLLGLAAGRLLGRRAPAPDPDLDRKHQ